MNDPFAVLGVSPSSSEDEIKSAYRKLAKKYHPDLNPGDQTAERKMREVNEAYTQAIQIKKNGGSPPFGTSGASGSGNAWGSNPWGGNSYGAGNPFSGYYGQSSQNGPRTEYRYEDRRSQSGNPFGAYGFDPFADFFSGASRNQGQGFRSRAWQNPDLRTAADLIRAENYTEALRLLNRVPLHDADWHALYARADLGLGNRISAMDHARTAVQMAPDDDEYRQLLAGMESGRQTYRQARTQSGYDYRSMICGNPFMICILFNCCCGRAFWC